MRPASSGTPPLFPRHSHSGSGSSSSSKPPLLSPHLPRSPSGSSSGFGTPQGSPTPSTASSAIDEAWDAMLPTPGRRRRFGGLVGGVGGSGGGSPLAAAGRRGGGFWMKRADSAPALASTNNSAEASSSCGALVLPPDAAAKTGGGGVGRSASTALAVWGERLAGSGKALLGHSPRDAVGGVSGGVASVAAGIGLGITTLVAAPALGASAHGAKGFLAGLGAGLAGAVVLPVAGLVGGLTCAIGGVVNTPASVVQMLRGRQWCPLQRKWIRYDLQEEARRVLGDSGLAAAAAGQPQGGFGHDDDDDDEEEEEDKGVPAKPPAAAAPQPPPPQPAAGAGAGGGNGGGSDVSLYAVLGVDPSAGFEAIKRAYYREALTVHPDRTSDPEATRRFQQLSEAYQVLSTPALRAAYDKEGDAGYRDAVLIDADLFFGMVFGAERFRPYLGKLFLASAMGALSHFAGDAAATGTGGPPTASSSSTQGADDKDELADAGSLGEARRAMTSTQIKREVRIALHLSRVLKPLLEGRHASFQRFCAEEAKELSQRALGPLILRELGTVYTQVAGAYLGGLSGLSASLGRRRVRLQRQADVAGATVEAVRLGKRFIDVYNTPQTHRAPHRSSSAPALYTPTPTTDTTNTNKKQQQQQPPSPTNSEAPTAFASLSLSASSSAASLRLMTPPGTLTPEAPAYPHAHTHGRGEECKEEPTPTPSQAQAPPQPQAQRPAPAGGQQQGPSGGGGSGNSSSKEQKLEEEGLPRLVSVMWKLAAWDITETVGRACGKLLSDAGAGKEERRLRAQGLLELGRAFRAEAEQCLAAAGGKVDYRREWEGLDREMFRRYESSASIHTMAAAPPRPGSLGSMGGGSGSFAASVSSSEAVEGDGEEEEGLLVL